MLGWSWELWEALYYFSCLSELSSLERTNRHNRMCIVQWWHTVVNTRKHVVFKLITVTLRLC